MERGIELATSLNDDRSTAKSEQRRKWEKRIRRYRRGWMREGEESETPPCVSRLVDLKPFEIPAGGNNTTLCSLAQDQRDTRVCKVRHQTYNLKSFLLLSTSSRPSEMIFRKIELLDSSSFERGVLINKEKRNVCRCV